ncbi:MAG TPA: hypothetical protein VGS07_27165 [Thermoanaerobaculia bacterium]|jgi:hypothetical protein|nr:hypothetical protein [Thermoanaerobaculia bacterium]
MDILIVIVDRVTANHNQTMVQPSRGRLTANHNQTLIAPASR